MKINIKIISTILMIYTFVLSGQTTSFFSDRKAHSVGDVVTIIIRENADASQKAEAQTSSNTKTEVSASNEGNLTSYLPLFGSKSKINNEYDGSDQTEQSQTLQAKMAAVITNKTDEGMYKIKGEKRLEVNGEKNLLKVEGLIRSRDIKTDNSIYSYNIANASVIFRKSGLARRFIKPGTIQKLLNIGLTGGLIALAFIGGLQI